MKKKISDFVKWASCKGWRNSFDSMWIKDGHYDLGFKSTSDLFDLYEAELKILNKEFWYEGS
jgi:hypothetical protein